MKVFLLLLLPVFSSANILRVCGYGNNRCQILIESFDSNGCPTIKYVFYTITFYDPIPGIYGMTEYYSIGQKCYDHRDNTFREILFPEKYSYESDFSELPKSKNSEIRGPYTKNFSPYICFSGNVNYCELLLIMYVSADDEICSRKITYMLYYYNPILSLQDREAKLNTCSFIYEAIWKSFPRGKFTMTVDNIKCNYTFKNYFEFDPCEIKIPRPSCI